MINGIRGEVSIKINNKDYVLCLTLGALAELETAFAINDFSQLSQKFQKLNAKDLLVILAILLKGGQNPIAIEELKEMRIELKEASSKISECFEKSV